MPLLPSTLALIDDDTEFAEFLSQHLREQGIRVEVFPDSDDLLTTNAPYGYDFYLIDLTLPGVDGLQLVRLLRRRTQVGIVVASGKVAPDSFKSVIEAGADMYLTKPVSFEQVLLTVRAIHRRTAAVAAHTSSAWVLDRRGSVLIAPDMTRVELSDGDLTVMDALFEAHGQPVSRETLCRRLGHDPKDADDNWLHGTIYRLRRRIERSTPLMVPLQSVTRVGYVFRAELRLA